MIEDLHTEFKREWSDKYLKNIAAFANTDGGILYIGIDDNGKIAGVKDVKTLLKNSRYDSKRTWYSPCCRQS